MRSGGTGRRTPISSRGDSTGPPRRDYYVVVTRGDDVQPILSYTELSQWLAPISTDDETRLLLLLLLLLLLRTVAGLYFSCGPLNVRDVAGGREVQVASPQRDGDTCNEGTRGRVFVGNDGTLRFVATTNPCRP